jgi:hypothetical protein
MSNMSPNHPLVVPNLNGAVQTPFSEGSRYCETREAWPVWYENQGVQYHGTVMGFSDAGWHIVGDAVIQPGLRLALRVQLPNRPGLFCIPSVVVQKAEGRAFVIQVQLPAAS